MKIFIAVLMKLELISKTPGEDAEFFNLKIAILLSSQTASTWFPWLTLHPFPTLKC